MDTSLQQLPPLILIGAVFLFAMGMVGRQGGSREAGSNDHHLPNALRSTVVALLLVAAVAHIPVIPEHLEEAPYMGFLFIAFTVASFGVATLLAARPSPTWYLVASGLCVAAVGAYVATRLVAFPQLADDVGLWAEPLGLVSISAESAAVALSLLALRSRSQSYATATIGETGAGRFLTTTSG